jgi:glycosyltransferase involved in cell wall biosynthesis
VNFLHVIHRYYPYVGGSEIYFQEICERLAREGHGVSVYTTDAWDLEHFWAGGKRTVDTAVEVHNGVRIERFPVERLPASALAYPALRRAMVELAHVPNTARLLFSLSRWTPHVPALERALDSTDASGNQFDLVHAANISLDSIVYAAYRFALQRRIPFVVTPFTHLGEPGDRRILSQCTMPHQIEMLRRADAVVTQTGLETEALAQRGVPRGKMHEIGVGVNRAEVLGGDAARFRTKYQIDGPIVFSVGTAAFDKGTMHLVEAMERLWKSRRAAANTHIDAPTLVIAGPQLSQFQRFLANRPSETMRRTHVLGFIPDADKRDLFAAGDVFVLPSRTDSFGIVYLEAWLYNKPVIGAWAGGVPAVITDGRDGFLVRFGDTDALSARIEQLLTDRGLAQCLGEAGHAKVLSGMTWDRKYAQLRGLYEELAGGR